MRVLIDTNVLISAALSANGTPFQAYVKAASYPNHGLICEQNVDEMKRIFNKKFPNRLAALDKFLSVALLTLKLVPVPTDENVSETQIRDVNDRPILRAAIEAKADVLLTGDKDFLESGVKNPAIMTPAEFLKYCLVEKAAGQIKKPRPAVFTSAESHFQRTLDFIAVTVR